jgi:hypothetical protein
VAININWQSTKFIHALLVQVVASVALFTRHMDAPTWVAASTIALGIYSIADVMQRKNDSNV